MRVGLTPSPSPPRLQSAFYYDHHNFQIYSGHKSNFGGHAKHSVANLYAFALVYKNTCGRIFPTLPPASPGGLYAEAFQGNTCILADAGTQYFDLGEDCEPGPQLAARALFSNNSVFVPQGNGSADVRCGKLNMRFQDWVASGSDNHTVINYTLPAAAEIIQWAKTLLGGGAGAGWLAGKQEY